MLCRLKSCTKCGGDLILEEPDWRCVQCSQYYYVWMPGLTLEAERLYPTERNGELPHATLVGPRAPDPTEAGNTNGDHEFQGPRRVRSRAYRPRTLRSINSVIDAKIVGDSRWWQRNRVVIEYLDNGLSVPEISQLTDRGQRQVRTVRERLVDLRQAALAME